MKFIALLFLLLCNDALAQTSPGFISGKPVCADYPSDACPPPANPFSLNQAFQSKADYPYLGPVSGPVNGVQFSGTPSVGQVPIAISAGAAAWASLPPITPRDVAAASAPTNYINVTDAIYGATGNSLRYSDGTITASSNAFSSASATFSSADVGKSIIVDYAGVGGAPLVTTISTFVDAHSVTLTANASISVPYLFLNQCTPATTQSGSGDYIAGDTITLPGGAACQAAFTTVSSVAQNANGSGGTILSGATSGNCVVTGTTGSATTSGAQKFSWTVTITSGAISAIVGSVYGGAYTTNPADVTNEPVVGCGNLSGATMSIHMGVLSTSIPTPGSYASAPSNPISQASTSGAGTGFTATGAFARAGAFTYGTDDTAALTSAINVETNRNNLSGASRTCIFMPAGIYLITVSLPVFTNAGCVVGAGTSKTIVVPSSAMSGDIFSWQDNWYASNYPFTGVQSLGSADVVSPIAAGIKIVGSYAAPARQNAFMFYRHNDNILMRDIEVVVLHGQCLGLGVDNGSGQSYSRESSFWNLRFSNCGIAALTPVPAAEITCAGSGDCSNELGFYDFNCFAAAAQCLAIRSNSIAKGIGNVHFDRGRVEGAIPPLTAPSSGGDLVQIGDSAFTGRGINNIVFKKFIANVSIPGYAALAFYTDVVVNQPFNIDVDGTIPTGLGAGVSINAGRGIRLRLIDIATSGTALIVGPSTLIGGGIQLDMNGRERTITKNIDSSSVNLVTYVLQATPWGTSGFSLNVPDGTVLGGATRGTGCIDLQTSRITPTQICSGALGVISGGFANAVSGTGSNVTGGQANLLQGQWSRTGGLRTYDRIRYGVDCYGSGDFANVGDAQMCQALLRCTINTDGGTCRLTTDGFGVANTNNCFNLPGGTAYSLSIMASAIDNTTPANSWGWFLGFGSLTRSAGVATTDFTASGSPATIPKGTTTGIGMSATADTTNGCLNLTFTHPTGTTEQWDVVAKVSSTEVQ